MAAYASYTNASAGAQYGSGGHSYRTAPLPGYTFRAHTFAREGSPTPTHRSKPSISSYRSQRSKPTESLPYQQTTQTYAWVVEQECLRKAKKDNKIEEWVLEQQFLLLRNGNVKHADDYPPAWGEKTRRHMWEDLVYSYELEAEQWMRQQEETRRLVVEAERQKARCRHAQDEMRRIEARIRQKREAERQKRVEEKLRAQMEAREKDKKERAHAQTAIAEAWTRYENGWESLMDSSEPLGFSDIPWLMKSTPRTALDITPAAVVSLLLSPFHSMKQSRKDRIRSAQLRWHPDRFRRLMNRVKEEDKEAVEEGVGIIARCLNDLMSKEKHTTRSS